jgi:glucose uptake protein
MILPATYAAALALTIISLLCWGSWANTFKMTRKWRFELFYFDFAFGVLISTLTAAFTLGSLGDELSVIDNVTLTAGKRQIAYALAAGGIFNLANLLLVAAISIAGLTVGFPVTFGLALMIGVVWNYIVKPDGSPVLLFGGAFLVVLAVAVNALAYRAHSELNKTSKKNVSAKALILSLAAGLLMGSFFPLIDKSRMPEIGLGPYAVALIVGTGVLTSTFLYNLYFMNLPVQGEPVPFNAYFAARSIRNHLLGLLGGILWSVGAIANFVAAAMAPEVKVGPGSSYAMANGAPVIAALWGLLVWKEFAGAAPRVKLLFMLTLILFTGGLALVAVGHLSGS